MQKYIRSTFLQRPSVSIWGPLLITLLSMTGAKACISDRQRGQTVVLTAGEAPLLLLPIEYSVAPGDLLALFAPKLTKVKIVDKNNKGVDVVQEIGLHPLL